MTGSRFLIYFAATQTDVGTLPAHYVEVNATEAPDWLAEGGKDVTDDGYHQRAYQREIDAHYGRLL